jgi:hypothetical protein
VRIALRPETAARAAVDRRLETLAAAGDPMARNGFATAFRSTAASYKLG